MCGYVVGPLDYSRTGKRCMCKCQKRCVEVYNNDAFSVGLLDLINLHKLVCLVE